MSTYLQFKQLSSKQQSHLMSDHRSVSALKEYFCQKAEIKPLGSIFCKSQHNLHLETIVVDGMCITPVILQFRSQRRLRFMVVASESYFMYRVIFGSTGINSHMDTIDSFLNKESFGGIPRSEESRALDFMISSL